ncbi:MAG TPA: pilin [Patescibacteria group bacterium]|nr:pilin [Patescibacteria group bacterium]
MRRFFMGVLALSVGLLIGAASLLPNLALADSKSEVCNGIIGAGGSCTDTTGTSVGSITKKFINLFSWVVGVVAVIMIMVAGFRYITAGGEASKVGGAKTTLIYALVGLIIAAMAQFIVQTVLKQTTNATTTGSTFSRSQSEA